MILIYVDYILLVSNNDTHIAAVKTQLHRHFSIKDMGSLKYFLGIEVARSADGFVLSQRKYAIDILRECGMLGCRPSGFPMEQKCKLHLNEDEVDLPTDPARFHRLLGRLQYLTVTRPDITYAVNTLSCFTTEPTRIYMEAAERILRS